MDPNSLEPESSQQQQQQQSQAESSDTVVEQSQDPAVEIDPNARPPEAQGSPPKTPKVPSLSNISFHFSSISGLAFGLLSSLANLR